MTSGRRELPDISVPRVFHKLRQLLCIVSGETGSCCFTTSSLSLETAPALVGTLSHMKVWR